MKHLSLHTRPGHLDYLRLDCLVDFAERIRVFHLEE